MSNIFDQLKVDVGEPPKDAPKATPAKTTAFEPKPKRPVGRPSTSQIEKELAEEIQVAIQLVCMGWSIRDPGCATVLSKASKDIAADLAHYGAKNERVRKFLQSILGFGEVMPIIVHISPVAKAIYAHHLEPKLNARKEVEDTPIGVVNFNAT